MLLLADDPKADNVLVFFNNKLCKSYIAADDNDGWVDIIDINNMAPLILDNKDGVFNDDILDSHWEEQPIKRIYGKVEFKQINK